ncbi:MAG TPA: glycoside-pentoside-hexuronide (GPH):cation symporter [Nevskia sp.]|nr:glycoside-pentoside-hexuronide (GPH):cation symporter [Nevskia sp.]
MRHREDGLRTERQGRDGLAAGAAFGFAVGDFGLNLYWQGLGLFLVYFHTDVLGLPASWAGLAYLAASVWDGLSDPLLGLAADRTRTRWGRYRPYLLLGSLPLALAFVLSFSAPRLPLPLLVGYALASQLLVRTLYNALAIPYASLSAAMTRDSAVRTTLSGLRMQCAFAGGIAVAWLMPALAQGLVPACGRAAYAVAAAIVGAFATATFLWCFAAVREPAVEERAAPAPLLPEVRAFLRAAGGSAPLLRLLAARFAMAFAHTMHIRNTMYFLKYVLGDAGLAPRVLPLFAALSLLSVPLWVWLIRRSGKRGAWQSACLLSLLGALALHLPAAQQPAVALALLGAFAVGTTGHGVCFWAMLPDTVEYSEWRFGRRDEAKVFGIASLIQKLAMGLSALAAGLLLDACGFAANQPQGAGAIAAIRASLGLIPALGMALSLLLMRGYDLDEAAHRRILASLEARRGAGRQED